MRAVRGEVWREIGPDGGAGALVEASERCRVSRCGKSVVEVWVGEPE